MKLKLHVIIRADVFCWVEDEREQVENGDQTVQYVEKSSQVRVAM